MQRTRFTKRDKTAEICSLMSIISAHADRFLALKEQLFTCNPNFQGYCHHPLLIKSGKTINDFSRSKSKLWHCVHSYGQIQRSLRVCVLTYMTSEGIPGGQHVDSIHRPYKSRPISGDSAHTVNGNNFISSSGM